MTETGNGMTQEERLLEARQKIVMAMAEYVDFGLPIIPLCSADHKGMSKSHISRCNKPGKVPLIKGWQTWSETTESNLRTWMDEFGYTNVGLPLGDASGYVGIDIDGEFGDKELDKMSGGVVPVTWEYTTGAGRRLLYQIPVGMKTKKFKIADDKKEHSECAFLCTGQETVLPPSIHHSGRVYTWKDGHSPFEIDCAMSPDWLLDLIREKPTERKISATIDLSDDQACQMVGKINFRNQQDFLHEFDGSDIADVDIALDERIFNPESVQRPKKYRVDIPLTGNMLEQEIPDGQRDNTMTQIIGSFCARYRALGKDRIMILAMDHNERYCNPPLERASIETKVNHLWELEQMKSSQFKEKGAERRDFEPNVLANAVLNVWEEEGYCLEIQSDADTLWYCKQNEGPWRSVSCKSSAFFAMFSSIIGNPKYGGKGEWTTSQRLRDVAVQIVIKLRQDGRVWDSDVGNIDTQSVEDCKYIPLKGGKLLDWRTEEISPWTPKAHYTYTLPVEYNPDAKCPYWEARLREWLPEDGARKILQEYVGYSLIPYMGFEKVILLLGEGANGKSIFLESIQGLLGTDVVGSASMKNIFSRFGAAQLQGKILNICNEAGSDYLRNGNADEFKNLVSGGRVMADVKNQPHVCFNNTAKFLFSANHEIKTNDKSAGWSRRLLIIPFDRCFSDSGVTKSELMLNIKKEYEGVFTWAVRGLQRLMRNKGFSESVVVQEKAKSYAAENNVAADFFDNCLVKFDPSVFELDGRKGSWGTPTKVINELFDQWVQYRESGIQKPKKYIKDYMENKLRVKSARSTCVLHSNQKQTTCWVGISIKITNTEFLEILQEEGEQSLRELAMKTLKQMDSNIA